MSQTYAILSVLGFSVAAVATLATMALRGRPTEWRWRVRQLSRFGIFCACVGAVMRITQHPDPVATGDQALLALSLGVMMMARAHSEIRRHFIEAQAKPAKQGQG